MDRDEYPFAASRQGGAGASVEFMSPGDNRGAGSLFGHQIRGLADGTDIDVIPEEFPTLLEDLLEAVP